MMTPAPTASMRTESQLRSLAERKLRVQDSEKESSSPAVQSEKKLYVWLVLFCHPQADLVEPRTCSAQFSVLHFWGEARRRFVLQCSFWESRSKRSWLCTSTSGAARPGAARADQKNLDSQKFGWLRTSSAGNPMRRTGGPGAAPSATAGDRCTDSLSLPGTPE